MVVQGVVSVSVNWIPVKVPPPADMTAISGKTNLDVAEKCMALESCKAFCFSGGDYVMTSVDVDPNLCYGEHVAVIQCWTSESSTVKLSKK